MRHLVFEVIECANEVSFLMVELGLVVAGVVDATVQLQ
jgi:hypothetical protein